MAKYQQATLTGDGATTQNSAPLYVNPDVMPFALSLDLDTDGSTTGMTVQYTLDDPSGSYTTNFATDAKWRDHSTLAALTADTVGNLAFPVSAVRLQLDANGTDVVVLRILQAGDLGGTLGGLRT